VAGWRSFIIRLNYPCFPSTGQIVNLPEEGGIWRSLFVGHALAGGPPPCRVGLEPHFCAGVRAAVPFFASTSTLILGVVVGRTRAHRVRRALLSVTRVVRAFLGAGAPSAGAGPLMLAFLGRAMFPHLNRRALPLGWMSRAVPSWLGLYKPPGLE